ncbi:hypothetical protein FRC04_001592 [Tulasnella sp. 424]|nr:hypothetical protein FRC04_001592 [Tulasnella sp. 424]KAG8971358.1 hypothetical protein FRC05_011120 [Tulasnella sp. 425]
MLPGDSTREYVIFDGIDKSISFMDFVRQLESFPYCTDAFSVSQNMENVVPTYLYGEALRFYETLDPDCQEDWAQLRSKMVRRFPGIIRSGGLVRRSTTQWDEEGLPTLAKAPPTTSSKLAILVPVIDEAEDTASDPQEDALGQRRSFLSLSVLKGRLRVPSFSRALGRPGTPLQPYVTVHSMFISSTYGGTDLIPICTVDLSDPQAVAAAKKAPLLTLHSYNPASR